MCSCIYSKGGDYGPPELLSDVCPACLRDEFDQIMWEEHDAYMTALYGENWADSYDLLSA